jgi:restriction endonuclease S subunit
MRDGWREARLGDVLSLEYGKALKESAREGGFIPVYGSAGAVGSHSRAITGDGPSIIVGRKGNAGAVHWSEAPSWPIDTTYFVKLKSDIEMAFGYLLLQNADLPAACAQTGVPGLNRDRAYRLSVLVPPLVEQRRIVDLIRAVDHGLAVARLVSEMAQSLSESLREHLIFDAPTPSSKLSEISCKRGLIGGPFGSSLVTKDYTRLGVPVIRGANLSCGRYVGGSFVFVSEEKAESLARNIAIPDDLIVTQRGTLGQVALVPRGGHPRYVVSQSQMRLRPDTDVADIEYLYVALSSSRMRREVQGRKIATANPHINLGIFGELEIPLPPLDEQRRIAAIVIGAEEVSVAAVALVARINALRASLFDSLLSGHHKIPDAYDNLLEMVS